MKHHFNFIGLYLMIFTMTACNKEMSSKDLEPRACYATASLSIITPFNSCQEILDWYAAPQDFEYFGRGETISCAMNPYTYGSTTTYRPAQSPREYLLQDRTLFFVDDSSLTIYNLELGFVQQSIKIEGADSLEFLILDEFLIVLTGHESSSGSLISIYKLNDDLEYQPADSFRFKGSFTNISLFEKTLSFAITSTAKLYVESLSDSAYQTVACDQVSLPYAASSTILHEYHSIQFTDDGYHHDGTAYLTD